MLRGEPCQSTKSHLLRENNKKTRFKHFPFLLQEQEILPSAEIGFRVCYVSLWPTGNTQAYKLIKRFLPNWSLLEQGRLVNLIFSLFYLSRNLRWNSLPCWLELLVQAACAMIRFFFRKDAQHLLSILGLLLLISSGLLDCIGKLKSLLHRLSPEEEMCINWSKGQ